MADRKNSTDSVADVRAMRNNDIALVEAKYARIAAQNTEDARTAEELEKDLLEALGLAQTD